MYEQMSPCLLAFLLGLSAAAPAWALPEYEMKGSDRARDLEFPTEVSDVAFESSPRMALYKPDGDGPFPGLVLLHQCGGLRGNTSMLNWATEAVNRGYAVLMLDSLGPRGVNSVCMGPKGDVFQSRGARDALQAAAHLRAMPFVDKTRIAYAGFSWGAGNGLLLASNQTARLLGLSDQRFEAVVSFYPPCHIFPTNGRPPFTLIMAGIDRPLLVLLGGRDNETPPEECVADLKPQKESGAPIEWHLYADATHCWDCVQWNGMKKTDVRGASVEYLYDEAVTRDSANRMFDFIERTFKAAKGAKD